MRGAEVVSVVLWVRAEMKEQLSLGRHLRAIANRPYAFPLLVACVYLTYGALNIHKHGVTCDAPALFRGGDRVLYWLQNGLDPALMDMNAAEPEGFQSQFEYWPSADDRFHYPIFPAFVGSLTSYVLHDKLGAVDAIDGHHLGLVLLNGIALAFFAFYSRRLLGDLGGVFATLALLFLPLAIGHSFNNPKDWPCAQFYALSLLAAGHGVVSNRAKHVLIGGLFAGVALSAKLNGLFGIATLGAWMPVAYVLLYRKERLRFGLVASVVAAPFIAFAFFFVSWPWLYHGAVSEWYGHVHEYTRFMAQYGVSERDSWTTYPFRTVFWMTPPVVLLFSAIALMTGWWKQSRERIAVYALLVIWLGIPLLRIALPRSNFYDANRHFIEYVPALCALAGLGLSDALARVAPFLKRLGATIRQVSWVGIAAVLGVSLVAPVALSYPFETMYFNTFAGGLGGAQQRGLLSAPGMTDLRGHGVEGDYWFSTMRTAFEDALAHGARRDSIAVCGPDTGTLDSWGSGILPRFYETASRRVFAAEHMIVIPRESACCWDAVRQLESERPIVRRVELDGGLVYEILGPHTGQTYVPATPENHYTQNGFTCGALRYRPPPP